MFPYVVIPQTLSQGLSNLSMSGVIVQPVSFYIYDLEVKYRYLFVLPQRRNHIPCSSGVR